MFRYQFILNYMSKPTVEAKAKFLETHLRCQVNSHKVVVEDWLQPILRKRTKKVRQVGNTTQERTSKFIKEWDGKLEKMLSGQAKYEKLKKQDQDMRKQAPKAKDKRVNALIGNSLQNS